MEAKGSMMASAISISRARAYEGTIMGIINRSMTQIASKSGGLASRLRMGANA